MRSTSRIGGGVFLFLAASTLLGAQSPRRATSAYADLISASAQSSVGLWSTHRVKDRVYFEIPTSAMGIDVLVLKREQGGWQAKEQIIRWERDGDRVLLRAPEMRRYHDSLATRRDDEKAAGGAQTVAVFPVLTVSPRGAPLIDATALFTSPIPRWTTADTRAGDEPTSIDEARAYPENVIVTTARVITDANQRRYTRSRWNFVRLPAIPMKPRAYDRRFGYMYTGFESKGNDEPAAGERANILRWRLEKKDPRLAVSDAVRPIVFYIDPLTPPKWRPWIRRAVEAWQPVFEAAGFRNAIVARDAPTDSSWSMDDVRHSVLYWRSRGDPAPPFAGMIIDPRTGEMLQYNQGGASDPGGMNTMAIWYFMQASPLDPRARRFPLPDSLSGALLQMVMTHEIGHTLGLRDGSYGKFSYSVDSVRSKSWVRRMGHTPSIINYSRSNYVAQPEDSIPPRDLIQRIGPADFYSVHWGYAPLAGALTTDDERATLDAWARVQDTVPMYRYNFDQPYGPDGTIENIETTDPVTATGLGLKNLRRVMAILSSATPGGNSADRADDRELYDNVRGQWIKEMWNVVSLIGGYTQFRRAGYEPRAEWTPILADQQRRALAFLDTAAFRTPTYLRNPDLDRRVEPLGEVARIVGTQSRVLEMLFDVGRLHRLSEAETADASSERRGAYTLSQMLNEVRKSVWSELAEPAVIVDAYRQGLQQAHVTLLKARADPTPPLEQNRYEFTYLTPPRLAEHLGAFERSVLRADMQQLRDDIAAALPKAHDSITRAHLRQMLAQLPGQ